MRTKHLLAGFLCAGLVCLLAGCTSGQSSASPSLPAMYVAEVQLALSDPSTSSMARDILSDYWVSDAEYQEATAAYSQCMLNWGWVATIRDDPSLQTDMYPAPENPLAAD